MIYLVRRSLTLSDDRFIEITDGDAHYLFKVRRVGRDEPVFFYHEGTVFETRLIGAKKREGVFEIVARYPTVYKGPKIFVALAAIEWQRLEEAVRNGVEAGAHGFFLFHASRSNVAETMTLKHLQRIEQIIESAASQSRRRFLPEIRALGREVIIRRKGHHVVFHPEANNEATIEHFRRKEDIYLWIGPEGGFGEEDLFFFTRAKVCYAAFRTPVLRVENAVTFAVGIARHAIGYNNDIRCSE